MLIGPEAETETRFYIPRAVRPGNYCNWLKSAIHRNQGKTTLMDLILNNILLPIVDIEKTNTYLIQE